MLIPVGIFLRIRKSHRSDPMGVLVRHLSRKKVLRLIFGLTMVNFVIFAFVGYRGFQYKELDPVISRMLEDR